MVAVTGATGLIGRALVRVLHSNGVRVLTIGRGPASDVRWRPDVNDLDKNALEGLEAVVHLAGARMDVRWTRKRRHEIRDSRVHSTQLLSETLARLRRKPRVLVSGSAVGFYGNRGDDILDETSAEGDGFLAGVVHDWESAASAARESGIRVVNIRTGVVIARDGGMIRRLLLPFRLGLGGKHGSGAQWLSWIRLHDHVAAVLFLIDREIDGPVNLVAPSPVTNAEFVRAFGRVLGRPTFLSVPAPLLELAFGSMARETILTSQRVVPARLVASGFAFTEPTIEVALRRELDVAPG